MNATGETTTFPRRDGSTASGYLALPAADAYGREDAGVVIIHEALGLNEQIRGVADRFAADGWRALAVDLFDGHVFATVAEARPMVRSLDRTRALASIAAAVERLREGGGNVAVLGFCLGGALSITAGVKVPGVSGVACFYGIPAIEEADPSQLRAPFIGHFANQDDWITPAKVDELEQQLKVAKVFFQINRYDAQHAFFNQGRAEAYSELDAQMAWDRTRDFFVNVLT